MAIWLTNQNDKKYNWHSMLYVAVSKLLVIVPSFRGSVGEKREGMKLIFIFVSCSLHIFVSCHNWYLCLLTAARPPGGEQGGARGRRRCRQLGPGTFQVKNRSNFLTLPKCWQLVHSEWKIDATFWPSQNVGNSVQKLKLRIPWYLRP